MIPVLLLGTWGWLATHPCPSSVTLIILTSNLMTSVLHHWYCLALGVTVSTFEVRNFHPSIHPTIPPCLHQQPRPSTPPKPSPTTLEPNSGRGSRSLKPTPGTSVPSTMHVTGALTLVASDLVWQSIPSNQTSATRIAARDPPFRARPTWDQPAPHANIAAAAVVSLHKMEATRYAF